MKTMEKARHSEKKFPADGRSEFEKAVEAHKREIYFLILRSTGNREDAADLTQQTFLNAWRGWEKFQGRSGVRTWLYSIALNLCRDHASRRRETEPIEKAEGRGGAAASPLEQVVQDEAQREAVEAALALPEKQRNAVILRIFHDLPFKEIAETLNMSESSAKVNFHYGIQNLRKRLTNDERP